MICLRPHHGLCICHFIGKGYSDRFTRNMKAIAERLEKQKDTLIFLSNDLDAVCAACPHNWQTGCDYQEKVVKYDKMCLEISGFEEGNVVKWNEYYSALMLTILLPKKLGTICGDCKWQGICNRFCWE